MKLGSRTGVVLGTPTPKFDTCTVVMYFGAYSRNFKNKQKFVFKQKKKKLSKKLAICYVPHKRTKCNCNCIHRRAAEWASDLCPQFQTPYLKGKSKGSITVYYCVMCSRILACSFMTLGSSCIGYFSHLSDHIPIKSNLRKERFVWAHRLVEPIMVGEVWWLGHPSLVAGVYGMAYSHLGG